MPSTHSKRLGLASDVGSRARPATRHAAMARLEAWAPILLRGLACGLGLLGLAGIGMVASRSPELTVSTTPQLGLRIAELALAGPASDLASSSAPPSAEPEAAVSPPQPDAGAPSGAPSAARQASAGCPRAPAEAKETHRAEPPKARATVVLNRATVTELQQLPSVGAKRAAAIIELRARLGGFRRVTDLLRIKGIGPRTLERMLPYLELGEPAAPDAAGKAQP